MFWLTRWAIGFAKVVATRLNGASNAVLQNLDAGNGESYRDAPQYGPLGWYARPMPPVDAASATGLNPKGEAEAVTIRHNETIPIGFRDLRLNAAVNPAEGAIGFAHYGGGFVETSFNGDKDGTSITLYALRKTSAGAPDKAHVFSMDSTNANASISLVHETGQSLSMNKAGDITLMSADGSAFLQVKNGDLVLSGTSLSMPGGAIVGTTVPGSAQPVALGNDLLTFAAQVVAAISQIATVLNAPAAPVVSAPGTVTPVTTTPVASTKLGAAP